MKISTFFSNKNTPNSVKNGSGFTLMEILVATTLFAIVSAASAGLFVYTLKINRRSEALRQATQGMRNFVEFITKEVRNGQIDYGVIDGTTKTSAYPLGPCDVSAVGSNTYTAQDNKLGLITDDGSEECIFFSDDGGTYVGTGVYTEPASKIQAGKNYKLKLLKQGLSSQDLLPPNFRVEGLTFFVRPLKDPYTASYVLMQPFVTVAIKFVAMLPTGEQVPIYYQTSVSTNKYDLPHN